MIINRKLWTQYFIKNKFPPWTCLKCSVGLLELQKNTLNVEDTGDSRLARGHDAWEPDWIDYRFVALLKCNNKECRDCITLSGTGKVREAIIENYGYPEQEYLDVFYPKYFSPPPQIFPIPANTPEDIKEEIVQSFSIFLSDPNAAGNRVRTCIELILNQQKINKTVTKSGKRKPLTLHSRITLFKTKFNELGKNLLAIKWLGNAASHASGLEIDDIFDAYEILHHVLNEIYDNRTKQISQLTKKINKKKGKLSK